jgi:hypothetical protein
MNHVYLGSLFVIIISSLLQLDKLASCPVQKCTWYTFLAAPALPNSEIWIYCCEKRATDLS